MQITTTSLDEATLEVRITLDQKDLAQYVTETKTALAQELVVDGFRKGKVPQELADQHLSPEMVKSEALQRALEGSFSLAVKERSWDVARTDGLKVGRNDAEGLEYTLTVSVWPKLTLPTLADVKVARRSVEVSDAEVDEALETLRTMRASFLDKTGPASLEDRVEVDFDASIAGVPVEGGSSRNHPLVIGGKNFMPGFEEALVGLAAGDTKQFTLNAPADYYEPKLAGKAVDFTVTMRRVQSVLKPAADDAFAQAVGKLPDLAALKARIKEGAGAEKEEKEHQRHQLAILDALIEKSSVPAPKAMVEHELDAMITRFRRDLEQRGTDFALYLARLKKTESDMRVDWKKDAERQVRIMLILRQVAHDQEIVISPEELDATVAATAAEIMQRGQGTPESLNQEQLRTALADRMLTDRVLQYLEQTCTA